MWPTGNVTQGSQARLIRLDLKLPSFHLIKIKPLTAFNVEVLWLNFLWWHPLKTGVGSTIDWQHLQTFSMYY